MLTAIIVYDVESGNPVTDRVWGLTSNGTLIVKGRNGYVEVPKEGRYYVQYGKGKLERW